MSRMPRLALCLLTLIVVTLPSVAQSSKKKTAAAPKLPAGARMAQNVVIPPCGNQGKVELEFPTEITATGHVLDTVLDMVPKIKMVPVLKTGTTVTCIEQPFELRLYKDPKTGELKYPGPTLRVRRATATEPGDRIRVRLENHLKANGDPGCVWEKASKELCNCSAAVPPEKKPQCCNNDTEPNEALMACFHGANDSNLHFHGTHASPQEPQDWVLLQLQPYGTTVGPETQPMGDPSTVRQGSFQYDINPLPDNQAEGTHWYHPHKHGSTAEQVGNGLAGALIVEGPFDDWLRKQLPDLREKLMVIQEIHDLNFTSRLRAGTPMPLINGQLTPKITMNPGEIQRWRLIGATMEASAQLVIDFNGLVSTNRTQAMQIAMDGIQFSPNNYYCQPLLDPSPCDGKLNDQKFRLSPGNRADFLVKADPANAGQELLIPYEVFGRVERQGQKPLARSKQLDRVRVEEVRAALDALAPGAAQPALLRVYVCKPGSTAPEDKGCKNMAMQFPSTLPPLPSFLRDINPRPGATQTVQFQVVEPGTTSPPFPDGQFQIFVQGKNDNKAMQFNENCAVFNEPLDPDGGEQWTVSQNLNDAGDAPFHVFHIHTNPFQVMSTFVGGKEVSYNTCPPPAGKPSYACMTPIWQDSLTLPDNNKGSLPANQPDGYMVIRQRFEDYTGPYVLHCHFLGHEDRGMMLTVQTVCPNHEPNEYSETSTTQKECTFGKFIKALPLIDTPECKSATEKAAMMITHAAHERKKKQ